MPKNPKKIEPMRSFYLATAKYYVYTHRNLIRWKRKKQIVLYLTHGFPAVKARKAMGKSKFDFVCATGELSATMVSQFFDCSRKQVCITGYPRMDYFFNPDQEVMIKLKKLLKSDQYRKIFLWMPTFRSSIEKLISEDYLNNETGLPLFDTRIQLENLNEFLKEEQILIVLKIHHLQRNMPIFNEHFSNFMTLKDEYLIENGVQLYQLLPLADAMISDYSSVTADYMVLNRPIVYILNDFQEYKNSRGFFTEDIKQFMAGDFVYSIEEFKKIIHEIAVGEDHFHDERRELTKKIHTFKDGESSRRILDVLGIGKDMY